MYARYTKAQLVACRDLALQQNQRLFEKANALNRTAIDLLERPDFDGEMFFDYMQLRRKVENQFREALDHLVLINKTFPRLSNDPDSEQVLYASFEAHRRVDRVSVGEARHQKESGVWEGATLDACIRVSP